MWQACVPRGIEKEMREGLHGLVERDIHERLSGLECVPGGNGKEIHEVCTGWHAF